MPSIGSTYRGMEQVSDSQDSSACRSFAVHFDVLDWFPDKRIPPKMDYFLCATDHIPFRRSDCTLFVQELGIPTANLERGCLHGQLASAVTGIYGGWASIGSSPNVWPMVMSVGFNPFYGNKVGRLKS